MHRSIASLALSAAVFALGGIARADTPLPCSQLDSETTCAPADVGKPCPGGGTCVSVSCAGAGGGSTTLNKCENSGGSAGSGGGADGGASGAGGDSGGSGGSAGSAAPPAGGPTPGVPETGGGLCAFTSTRGSERGTLAVPLGLACLAALFASRRRAAATRSR